ncbi:putative MarR family transcriptional regulator [Nitratireductor aquibiodomus RA22]|uniref:DNA-binding transcriptional regulator, MarR family n=2 Tax=Nitratireductor aquibiodomus TaxID=204799 RepID=A0A1H4M2C3_9HYPH|nr:MarR family winged helix-turn-helix transcriptional regulator [Nitratireductor aquibiodomus]EIM77957.1 putative MarR family transcriptional regulator [Nitratireductor aquibiodomus RA22]SEB76665.1 DNA-binding transcriptional regulator, MarR family [Nitratireductor aquibiodomus]
MDQRDVKSLERQTALALERLAIKLGQYRPAEARTHRLSNQQIIIMAAIFDRPGCNVKAITEETGMFQSTISRSLEGLIASGHVRRGRSNLDSRMTELHLSETGSDILAAVRNEWRSRVSALLSGLQPADRRAAAAGIELLSKELDLQ